MTITPCRTCHMAEGCSIRREKAKAVRGLKLTAMKFKCAVLVDSLKPGQRVKADLKYVCTNEFPDEPGERTVDAVVMGWSKEKVRIYVPFDANADGWWLQSLKNHGGDYIHVLRVTPKQLHPIEGMVRVCTRCGLPEDADVDGWDCGPEGCCFFAEVIHHAD